MSSAASDLDGRARSAERRALAALRELRARLEAAERVRHEPVAIVGAACRFPGGASSLEQYWSNLQAGRDCIAEGMADRIALAGRTTPLAADSPARWGAFLDGIDLFDAEFFGLSVREAQFMDPQLRLLLETSWEAVECAGIAPEALARSQTGVFVAIASSDYALLQARSGLEFDPIGLVGAAHSMFSGRLAYLFDLVGPSLVVDTACSSSLVALHLAVQSLRRGECRQALVGGVMLMLSPGIAQAFAQGGFLAADGRTRTFDAAAAGYARGEGCGVLLLKRLSDARADGDPIHAVVRGSAVNQDGRTAGITAPNGLSQRDVIRHALRDAGVSPEEIGYVEAHGTATPLGDPIEMEALAEIFAGRAEPGGECVVGSVKTNVGHLEAAAGMASLFKVIGSLRHRAIPRQLHFETLSPHIDLEGSRLCVADRPRSWPTAKRRCLAGVSGFGFSGTNAHVVVEEAPESEPFAAPGRPLQLLAWSARSPEALEEATDRLAAHLDEHPEVPLADVAHTLSVGRRTFAERRVLVCEDAEEAALALEARDPTRLLESSGEGTGRPVAFLFPGLGEQYVGMGRDLYAHEPVFRAAVDRCAAHLRERHDLDLLRVLHAPQATTEAKPDLRAMLGRGPAPAAASPLDTTGWAQPAVFVIEWALAQLWQSFGVRVTALAGYSLGEYTAACVSGVFGLEDALDLVVDRARAIGDVGRGAMLGVSLSEAELAPWLERSGVSLSAVNGPKLCVVSGPLEGVEELERAWSGHGVLFRRLATEHAFHSRLMEPLLDRWRERVSRVTRRPPAIPWVSNLTGDWIRPEEAMDPDYWARHLREPVRFSAAIERLWEDESRVLLELGPGRSLASFAMQHPRGAGLAGRVVLGALRSAHEPRSDVAHTLETLGKLWLAGVSVDWKGFWQHERRRRVALPTYPFQRQRYWVDIPALPATAPAAAASAAGAEDARRPDLADWFYAPVWSRSVPRPPRRDLGSQHRWLLLADGSGIADALARRLEARGAEVWTVEPGPAFETAGERCFRLSPGQHDHFHALGDALRRADAAPDAVVSLWSATPLPEPASPGERLAALDDQQARHFLAPLFLAQMLETFDRERPLPWWIASTQLHAVVGGEPVRAEKALLLGPCQVIPKEHPLLRCRSVDLEAGDPARAARDLEAEILRPAADDDPPVVAWRGGHRWVRGFEPVRLEASDPAPPAPLRPGGTYLLTGGLGGLGLALARHLASRLGANLVLLGRTPLPDGAPGDAPPDEETRRRLDAVRALEATGSRVLTAAADVADPDAVGRVVAAARERFGRIDGVFHLAGVPGAGLVQLKSADMAAAVLAPKVRGTLVLEAALADDPPDFLALYSSTVALTGALGEVDYCAANAFLDQLALELSACDRHVCSLDWGAWRQTSWEALLLEQLPTVFDHLKAVREELGIPLEEGHAALERALAGDAPQLAVSTIPVRTLQARFDLLTARSLADQLDRDRPTHPRPALRNPYVRPTTDCQKELCRIWQRWLGVEPIGIYDSFFELGGNSLIGVQVVTQIRKTFGLQIPTVALFEAPNVAALSTLLERGGRADAERSPQEGRDRARMRLSAAERRREARRAVP